MKTLGVPEVRGAPVEEELEILLGNAADRVDVCR